MMNVVEVAMACVGTKEGSPEHKTIIDIYNGYMDKVRPFKMRMTDPWCAAFVSACYIAAGMGKAIPIECSCFYMKILQKKERYSGIRGGMCQNRGILSFIRCLEKKLSHIPVSLSLLKVPIWKL